MTECIAPPPPGDAELLAHLDGQGTNAVQAHVERCDYCRQRVNELASFQDGLGAGLYRLRCPSSLELGEYHLGLLPGDRRSAVERHLMECPHCAGEVAQLRGYLEQLAPDLEPRARAQRPEPAARPVSAGLAELVARLLPRTLAPALRGEARAPITAEADGIVVVLDVQPASSGRVTVLGQVADDDQERWTGARAEVHQNGALQQTATVDDLGNFRFDLLRPDLSVDIRLTPPTGLPVVVRDIELAP